MKKEELIKELSLLFENESEMIDWMNTPKDIFDKQSPKKLIESGKHDIIINIIDRMKASVAN